jgi:hypothetical protein
MKFIDFAKKYNTDGLLINDRGNGSAGAGFLRVDDDEVLAYLEKAYGDELVETDDEEAWELIRDSAALQDCPAPIAVAVARRAECGYQLIVGC